MSATKEKPLDLAITIEGKIIKSNFDDFKSLAVQQIESINYELNTDEEFGQAKEDVKKLDGFEKKLAESESNILKQMDEINTLITGCRELKDLSREKRLLLSRTINEQTAKVKKGIEDNAVASIEAENRESYRQRIVHAMKGKRTLETLEEAALKEASDINIHNQHSDAIISEYVKKYGSSIAPDSSALRNMDHAALRDQLARRAELAEEEKERKRLEAEAEKAKAELEEMKRKEAEKISEASEITDKANNSTEQDKVIKPTKVDSIPVSYQAQNAEPTIETPRKEETQLEEINRFISTAISCFAPLKQARENLKHPKNIESAGEFAKSLGAAWTKLKNQTS